MAWRAPWQNSQGLRRLILPGGQITQLPVQPPLQKYSGSLLTQITSSSSPSRPNTEGRFAIVTNVGQGVRWTQAALLTRALPCGRRSRVVLTPQWLASSSREAKLLGGDGDNKARSPRRARRKPLKPIACGNAGCSGATVVTNSRVFLLHARLRVQRAPGIPHALHFRAKNSGNNSDASRRGMADVYLVVIASQRGGALRRPVGSQ